MGVGFLSDAQCDICAELIENTDAGGFELHELKLDEWYIVCIPCTVTLELNEGK